MQSRRVPLVMVCLMCVVLLLLPLLSAQAAPLPKGATVTPRRPLWLPLVLRHHLLPVATSTPTRGISPTSTATPTWTPFPTSSPTATETERPTPTVTHTPTPLPSNWVFLLREDFEGAWPGGWEVSDYRVGSGEYSWAKRECTAHQGQASGWAVGGGRTGRRWPVVATIRTRWRAG